MIEIEGTNIPITYGAEKYLHDKGVICVPILLPMRVGVICAATEYQGTWQSAAFHVIMEKVRRNAKQVLEEMTTREILPREAAVDLAIERLRKCMSYRRWSLFSSAPGFV